MLTYFYAMGTDFAGKKVLVFGLGINQGGLGAALFFTKRGANVRVTDLKNAEQLKPSLDALAKFDSIEYILGEHRNKDFDWADLIIKNPGVKPQDPYLLYAKSLGKQIEMDMGIFLRFVKPGQIIGVTGTKGKSTTASLIYEVLKAGIAVSSRPGGTPHVEYSNMLFAGNIGKSVLDTVEFVKSDTIVVLEISSFQLEAFEQHTVSPKWAVITNITPDHLNYYGSMDEYINSKRPIAKYQTSKDFLFLRKNDPITNTASFLEGFKGDITYFSPEELFTSPTGGLSSFAPKLKGEHNLYNCAAALSMAKAFGIDQALAIDALLNFGGVEFRMQLVKEVDGIKIYNDTAATGPDAGIKALETFPGCILIAGGVNKNLLYKEYARVLDKQAKRVFFLEGDATEEMKKYIKQTEKIMGTYNNFEDILIEVKKTALKGDVVLFSPAAASFNLFQNEFDRGRKFSAAVSKVFG